MPADIIPARLKLRAAQVALELNFQRGDQQEAAFQTGLSPGGQTYGGGPYGGGPYGSIETGAFQWDAFQGEVLFVQISIPLMTAT